MKTQTVLTIVVLGTMTLPGCRLVPTPSEVAQRVTLFVECVAEDQALAVQERQAQLEALRKEHQMQRQVAATEAADVQAQIASKFEQSVRTQLGLAMDYKLNIGKPQIDVSRMKSAIAKYERDMQEHEQIVAMVREHNDRVSRQRTEDVRYAMANGRGQQAIQQISWSKKSCKAPEPKDAPTCAAPPTEAQTRRTEPQIDEPDAPSLNDLSMNVPISIELSGEGQVKESQTRRTPKKEPQIEAQEKCNPRKPSCDAPSKSKCRGKCKVKCSPECNAPGPMPVPASEGEGEQGAYTDDPATVPALFNAPPRALDAARSARDAINQRFDSALKKTSGFFD